MNLQKKKLIKMILVMIKEVYRKTLLLEDIFNSQSIHMLPKNYDPLKELLEILEITGEEVLLVSQLVSIYLEDEMTEDEIILEIWDLMKHPV